MKARFKLCVLAVVCIAQELVTLMTLGFVVPEWRAKVLFSDWMDE
jgi:formate/nitrite transporter FocA (FNT family)